MTLGQATDRAGQLVELLPEAPVDLMLVTDLVNVRYLTGYTGSNGLALVGEKTRVFLTDFRYVERAADEVYDSFERHRAPQDLIDLVEEFLPPGELRLGFEAAHMTFRDHGVLRDMLPGRIELVPVEGLVERLRKVKDPAEVERIHEASRVADAALGELLDEGLIGRTERDIEFGLAEKIHRHGGDGPSFETIVAAGAYGALPHSTPRDREIQRGEVVIIDWGAELDGYHSDCTRTLAAGQPSAEAREVYAIVLEAQLAGLAATRDGEALQTVDAAARDVIRAAGYDEYFGHGLGHGVGLAIHEGPRLSQRSEGALEAGNVVTVEPGIYLPGRFGVRIEDLVVVSADGSEILTSIPKDLLVVE